MKGLKYAAIAGMLAISAIGMTENRLSADYAKPALNYIGREMHIRTSPAEYLKRSIDDAGRYAARGRYKESIANLQRAFPDGKKVEEATLSDLESLAEKVIIRFKSMEGYRDSLSYLANSLRNERSKSILAESIEKTGIEGSKKKELFLAYSLALSQFGTVELAKEKAMMECMNHPQFQEGIYFFTKENANAILQDLENLAVNAILVDMEKNLIEKDISRLL